MINAPACAKIPLRMFLVIHNVSELSLNHVCSKAYKKYNICYYVCDNHENQKEKEGEKERDEVLPQRVAMVEVL